ncbi:MAG: hypothetical protein ACFHX7_09035 [Pseudomonadota bacterium]
MRPSDATPDTNPDANEALQFPDIEIYLKRPALAQITDWLSDRFGISGVHNRAEATLYTLVAPALECVVVENAVKGGFTSVWFRSGKMPWATDLDCAREAFTRFGLEVRCSSGPWQEGDDDAPWIRLTDAGESRVNWF